MGWQDLASTIIRAGAERLGGAFGGPLGGAVGGVLGGTIADAFGLPRDAGPQQIDAAIKADPEASDKLIAIQSESEQALFALEAETLRFMEAMADKDKSEGFWSWAWRPAGMWLNLLLWFWNCIVLPVINAITGTAIEQVPFVELVWFTGLYAGLYMGGHTVKAAMASYRDMRLGAGGRL